MGLRDRELNTLIRTDRPAENHAIGRVTRGALDEPPSVADRLGRDQDPLDVPAVDDVAEALPFLADQILGRYLQVLDEDLRRVMVEHRADRPNGDASVGESSFQAHDEDRQTLRLVLKLLVRCRARKK